MKTRAAVLWGLEQKWEVEEVDLDPPGPGEVLVRLAATGLCHSDEHLVTGDLPIPLPVVGGHEGAGTVVECGEGVEELSEGDSVILTFLPSCGRCSYCARGMGNLCELGAALMMGPQIDGTYRFHARGEDVGQMCLLGTFSEYTVVPQASVVKIDGGIPLDRAALIGCGVTTGYGSAVRTGEVRAGDTVVVVGAGGIGMNAIQGARIAGALAIVAVDPVKAILSMPGCPTSAAPVAPAPVMMLTTPGGSSACWMISANSSAVSEVVSAGLSTTVLPAASAGAIFHASINRGKFHGMTWPTTPRARGLAPRPA